MTGALLACDWGTTNLRAWVLDEAGAVVRTRDFELGVSRLQPGEAQKRFHDDVRPALGAETMPAILCGMIGSNLGWRIAPYAPCPASRADLAAGMIRVDELAHIVPGLICRTTWGASDVMRGEETQILGWLAEAPARSEGRRLVCLPGTHSKWAVVEDGRILRFQTAMTGELFSVLRRHSVLRSPGEPDDPQSFDEGLAAAGDGSSLAARLFSARARVVGDGKPADTTPSYLSGLLIGAEIASTLDVLGAKDGPVALVGDPALCHWYSRALTAHHLKHTVHDGADLAVRGLHSLSKLENRHAPG